MKKNTIDITDYTGGLFASHFMYIAPMVAWYEPGEQYEMAVSHSPLGTAICDGLTILKLSQVTSNMTLLATGMRNVQWKKQMYIKYGATDETPMAIMIMNWLHMDVAILKALMELRFEAVKGIRPHERKAQLALEL
jgi:hypothetical protein